MHIINIKAEDVETRLPVTRCEAIALAIVANGHGNPVHVDDISFGLDSRRVATRTVKRLQKRGLVRHAGPSSYSMELDGEAKKILEPLGATYA